MRMKIACNINNPPAPTHMEATIPHRNNGIFTSAYFRAATNGNVFCLAMKPPIIPSAPAMIHQIPVMRASEVVKL